MRSKTIYVLSSQVGLYGGAAKATLLLCEALREIGKQVTLFVTLRPAPEIEQRLAAQGVQIVLPLIRRGWRWRIPQKLLALQLALSTWRTAPALVHGVSLSAEASYLLRLRLRLPCPLPTAHRRPRLYKASAFVRRPSSVVRRPQEAPIYLWETTEALPGIKFVHMSIHKHLHKTASILAPSQTIARNIRATYNYQGKISVLPFWVDEPPQIPAERPRNNNLLYLGRLDMDKGIEYMIRAFTRVQTTLPGATLTICGGGAIDEVKAMVGNNQAIQVRGWVQGAAFEQSLSDCDALVLPSLHEGYPLSLLEACARGKPVITTLVGSIPEVFGGRACAILVPPRDSSALANAMLELLSEEEPVYRKRCQDARALFREVSGRSVILRRLRAAYVDA